MLPSVRLSDSEALPVPEAQYSAIYVHTKYSAICPRPFASRNEQAYPEKGQYTLAMEGTDGAGPLPFHQAYRKNIRQELSEIPFPSTPFAPPPAEAGQMVLLQGHRFEETWASAV